MSFNLIVVLRRLENINLPTEEDFFFFLSPLIRAVQARKASGTDDYHISWSRRYEILPKFTTRRDLRGKNEDESMANFGDARCHHDSRLGSIDPVKESPNNRAR